MRLPILIAAALAIGPASAAASCGGPFTQFRAAMQDEAIARGADPAIAAAFFDGVRHDPATLAADRRQGVFTLPFVEFARRLISANRMERGVALGWCRESGGNSKAA